MLAVVNSGWKMPCSRKSTDVLRRGSRRSAQRGTRLREGEHPGLRVALDRLGIVGMKALAHVADRRTRLEGVAERLVQARIGDVAAVDVVALRAGRRVQGDAGLALVDAPADRADVRDDLAA